MNTNGLMDGFQMGMNLMQPYARAKVDGAMLGATAKVQAQRDERVNAQQTERDARQAAERNAEIKLHAQLASDRDRTQQLNRDYERASDRRWTLQDRMDERKFKRELNAEDNAARVGQISLQAKLNSKASEFNLLKESLTDTFTEQEDLRRRLSDPTTSETEKVGLNARLNASTTILGQMGKLMDADLANGAKGHEVLKTFGDFFVDRNHDRSPRIVPNTMTGESSLLMPDPDTNNPAGLRLMPIPTYRPDAPTATSGGWGSQFNLRSNTVPLGAAASPTLNYGGMQFNKPAF